jgi:WD40 repeat protein
LFRFDPATGIGQEVVDLGVQFSSFSEFCYDAGSNFGYTLRTVGVNEVIALDIDAGNAFVLSSEALGIGSGPSAALISGLACDPTNGRLLIGDSNGATASILAVDTVTGNRTIVSDTTIGSGDALVSPTVVAASPDGSSAFVWDNGTNALVRVSLSNGDRSEVLSISFGPNTLQVLGMTMIDNEAAFISDQYGYLWSADLQSGEVILVSK